MGNRHIVDRRLPDRTNLMFYFPNPTESSNYFVVELPFFENVEIRERKKARLQKYSLISRSSNLYSYLGADSRQLTLSFWMTLPHIQTEHPEINRDKFFTTLNTNENSKMEREKFKSPVASPDTLTNPAVQIANNFLGLEGLGDSAKQVLDSNHGLSPQEREYIIKTYLMTPAKFVSTDVEQLHAQDVANATVMGLHETIMHGGYGPTPMAFGMGMAMGAAVGAAQTSNEYYSNFKFIDLILYWINIVRASVTNNASNPTAGPPIIRLRHGVMYQDIPCICTDYRMSWEEKEGYDLQTLLPRRIKIGMNLEEVRTGDFGEFDQNDIIKRDNLAGWESVINDAGAVGTMDPGYINNM